MSKVLVTGASGFIGTHLVRALVERGDTVTCLVRPGSTIEPLEALGVRLCVGDVTDADSLTGAVAGQEVVYHLAGLTHALSARQFHAVNAAGTRAVAEACAAQGTPPVLVSVSSLAAAGPSAPNRSHTETDPPAPVSHYGRSKRSGELALAAFAHRVPITIVRPPIVFGGGDRLMLPLFTAVTRFGVQALPSLSHPRFSMIHVADLVAVLLAAADGGQRLTKGSASPSRPQSSVEPEPCETPTGVAAMGHGRGYYYASGGEAPTLGEFSRMIARAAGRRRLLLLHVPTPVTWSVAAVMELFAHVSRQPVPLSLDKAREATAGHWTCSAEKAASKLGFKPGAPLRRRIRQTVAWYRAAKWL